MKLSKPQVSALVWSFFTTTYSAGATARNMHQGTLTALFRRELVRYHTTDYDKIIPTKKGEEIVLNHYYLEVIDWSVYVFGISQPPITIETTLWKMPLENFPACIAHENKKVRELAEGILAERTISRTQNT